MLASQVLGVAISGGIMILAVRLLSSTAWGGYTTALALVSIGTVFASSGVATLALREMSEDLDRQVSILGTSLAAIAVASVPVAIAIVPAALIFGYSRDVIVLVALALPLVFLQPTLALLQVTFNARHSLYLAARLLILQNVTFGVGALVVLLLGLGPVGLVVATVAAAIVGGAAAFSLLEKRLDVVPRFTTSSADIVRYLKLAVPIAGIGIVSITYEKVDVLMLSALSGTAAVARYSVAYSFILLTMFVPSVVSAAFFPVLHRAMKSGSVEEGRGRFLLVSRVFFLLSVPLALLLGVAAPTLVPLVYGDRYSNSAHVLEILAVMPVMSFQIYVFWYVVLSAGRERPALFVWVAGLLLNVAMNVVLIPRYGPEGAAVSWVCAETLVALLQALLVHRLVFEIPFRSLLGKPALSALLVVPVAVAVGVHLSFVGGALGATGCAALLLATGYIRRDELMPLARTVHGGLSSLRRHAS